MTRGARISAGFCLWLAAVSAAAAQSVSEEPQQPSTPPGTSPPAASTDPRKVKTIIIRPESAGPKQPVAPPHPPGANTEPTRVKTIDIKRADMDAAPAAVPQYMVQVSAQKSADEAEVAYSTLQQKYPSVLGGREAIFRKVELAAGTWYRAQVGPFGTAGEADAFCQTLKAAGGQCIVQRN